MGESTTQEFKSFDGVRLSYRTVGRGETVVLLHGFAADSEQNWFRPQVVDAIVGAGRQVVALDARGHGQSEKPHDPAAYADGAMVKDVQSLLDHLELGAADICGYSMGAMTTYRVAGIEPRVRSIVLGGVGESMFTPQFADRRSAIAEALVTDDPSTIENPVAKAFRAFAESTGADRQALAAIQSTSANYELQPTLSVRALVITGDKDVLIGSAQGLADRIPNATVVTVTGDHLSAVNDPAFRSSIAAFLAAG
jgi:pimeloyl-ACP methyl ester carboxylesterase